MEASGRPLLGDEEPVERVGQGTGFWATLAIFLKSYLGSGLLGMAAAFLAGGIIPTIVLVFSVAVLSCLCFLLLFHVRDALIGPGLDRRALSYEVVVEKALGRVGKMLTIVALIFTQMGFGTAYIIFTASNLEKLYPVITFREYCLIVSPLLVVLCWIRQLKWIAPVALFGTASIVATIVIVVYYCFEQIGQTGIHPDIITRVPWGTLPVAFGVNVYLFEGIGLILPLESNMEKPALFTRVMWATHLSIATLVSLFGLIGYLAFFLCTQGPIIQNLNSGALVAATIWSLNVCLWLTYPVQLVPIFEILETAFVSEERRPPGWLRRFRFSSRSWFLARSMALRTVVVACSVALAVAIPYFDLFLSLVGGLGSAQLMFIMPPLCYMAIFWRQSSYAMRGANIALLIFGIVTLVVTTTFTVISIVHRFEQGTPANQTACNVTMGE